MMPPWRRLACHIFPIIVSLIVGYVAVELFGDRYQPRDVIGSIVVPENPAPGDSAEVQYTAKDERNCTGISRRWIVDSGGVIYDLADIPTFQHKDHFDANKQFKFVHEFQVPFGITPGPATLHSRTFRSCNFIQSIFWPITQNYADHFVVAEHRKG